MEFREKIEKALMEIDSNVHYGRVPESKAKENWNYFVFGKNTLRKAGANSIDLIDSYWIAIVRENYIPDNLVFEVIDKLNEIPGLKLTTEDGNYEYVFKEKTDLVVEILTLSFSKVKKCGNLCH